MQKSLASYIDFLIELAPKLSTSFGASMSFGQRAVELYRTRSPDDLESVNFVLLGLRTLAQGHRGLKDSIRQTIEGLGSSGIEGANELVALLSDLREFLESSDDTFRRFEEICMS